VAKKLAWFVYRGISEEFVDAPSVSDNTVTVNLPKSVFRYYAIFLVEKLKGHLALNVYGSRSLGRVLSGVVDKYSLSELSDRDMFVELLRAFREAYSKGEIGLVVLFYKKWGLRGRKASPLLGAGMDSPLIESLNTSFSKTSFSDAKDAPPQLD